MQSAIAFSDAKAGMRPGELSVEPEGRRDGQ